MYNKLISIMGILVLVIIMGCATSTNNQHIDLPNGGSVDITSPPSQNMPATIAVTPIPIKFTNVVDGVDNIQVGYLYSVETSSGTQHDTAETKARFGAFKIYHYGAVGLFILGVVMIVLKKPPEVITGIMLIGCGVGLSVVGSFMPMIAKYAIHILIGAIILCIIYVAWHHYISKTEAETEVEDEVENVVETETES